MSRKNLILILVFLLFAFVFALVITSVRLPVNLKSHFTPEVFVSYLTSHQDVQDKLFLDQSILQDTQSIFLPTEWSARPNSYFELDEDLLFKDFPESTALKANASPLAFMQPYQKSKLDPIDLTNVNFEDYFQLNSLNNVQLPENKPLANILVTSLIEHNEPLYLKLPLNSTFSHNNSLWKPLKYLVLIENEGITPSPLKIKSSQNETVDNYFIDVISSLPEILNLNPGYYLITVSP